jgi:hypothetical protein
MSFEIPLFSFSITGAEVVNCAVVGNDAGFVALAVGTAVFGDGTLDIGAGTLNNAGALEGEGCGTDCTGVLAVEEGGIAGTLSVGGVVVMLGAAVVAAIDGVSEVVGAVLDIAAVVAVGLGTNCLS